MIVDENTAGSTDVFKTDQFVGRSELLAECLSLLIEGHAPQSVLVHGDRWSGKTWLLNRLQAELTERTVGVDPCLAPYIDVSSISSPRSFYARLCVALALPNTREDRRADHGPSAVTEMVKERARVGRTVVILDDFDAITRNPAFPIDFFTHLRSLVMLERSRFAWVLSASRPLRKVCHSSEVQGSPFFNIFSERLLGAFTAHECSQLVQLDGRRLNAPLERHGDDLVHVAGRFPLFLHMASRYAAQQHRTSGHIDIRGVTQKIRERARPYFEHLWSELTESEQAVLETVARALPPTRHAPGMLHELVRRGFLEGPALASGGYAIACGALQDVVLARTASRRSSATNDSKPESIGPRSAEQTEAGGGAENRPVRIFVSYSHKNRRMFRQIFDFICGISRSGVELWFDERLTAGDLWDERIREELAKADIALVLVSQEYLTSTYCMEVEAMQFTRSRVQSGLVIVPVLLSHCQIDEHEWLASTHRVPRGGTYAQVAGQRAKRDALLMDLLKHLQTVVDEVRARAHRDTPARPH